MLTYLIAATVTFIFTTVLTIAGVGAAFILIPIFLALHIPLLTAMSTALLLNSIAMIFASISYARDRLIVWKTALPILIVATALSPLGARTAEHLPRNVLLWLFVGFLIFAGSMMLFYEAKAKEEESNNKKLIGYGVAVGGVAGYLGGLLGVGGGNFIVPVLVWLGFDPKKASATTAFVVIFSSFSGFLGHATTGHMNIWLLLLCAAGSISGALLGAYLMRKKLSRKQVKLAIGLILYIIAAKMIWDLVKPMLS
ncbi:MAG: sulfite exporter TauE/SafE family protein [Candidatus Aminicenantes bacterium]|nr:sulfite exporter TauE/SafE family protein [Candidatus Aminicenantes bacterium]